MHIAQLMYVKLHKEVVSCQLSVVSFQKKIKTKDKKPHTEKMRGFPVKQEITGDCLKIVISWV